MQLMSEHQQKIMIYLDAVIILAENSEAVLEHLRIVLEKAAEYGLEIKQLKCQFLCRTVDYLQYVTENGKVSISAVKIQAVAKFPEPKSVKQVTTTFRNHRIFPEVRERQSYDRKTSE